MSEGNKYPFSAADAALGYLYQVRVALLWTLRKLKSGDEFLVSIETLDDVTFESRGGSPEELLQTKHHRSREASLSDASSDLWKTLRIWFDARSATTISATTDLHLLTTGSAPAGSAASYLRSYQRNVDAALAALESTAQSSASVANAEAYRLFLSVPAAERKAILDRVVVLDAAPTVADLEEELLREVFWAVDRQSHDAFFERLEGWWLRRVIKHLAAAERFDRILAGEVESEMSDLRDQFKRDSLPIDEDLLTFTLDDVTQEAHAAAPFVRQLELVKAGKRRIAAAVRDYYRAFAQRSRWLRDDLLLVGDLEKYERRVLEEWELVFEAMRDEVGADAADEAKEQAGREVLKWAERVIIPIRPSVTEPFVTRGSLHMLADELRVGWHSEFSDRLTHLLDLHKGAA